MCVCLCICVGSCVCVSIYNLPVTYNLPIDLHIQYQSTFPFLVFFMNQGLEFSFVDESSQFGICRLNTFSQPISPSLALNLSVVLQDWSIAVFLTTFGSWNLWVSKNPLTGATYQISCKQTVYIMIHNSCENYSLKYQWNNFRFSSSPHMRNWVMGSQHWVCWEPLIY